MNKPDDPATLRTTEHPSGTESSRSTPPSAVGKLDWLKPVDNDEASMETVVHEAGTSTQDFQPGELATSQFVPFGSPSAPARDELATKHEVTITPTAAHRRLGRFNIVKELGAGAFGKVYLGRDPQLDREVAIKVAKIGLWSTEEDRTRFLREARAAAQLRHPHIVPVYEFGTVNDSDYIAYQYVKGSTLRDELRRHTKLPVERAVELTVKIADALHYAHGKKIVHRDIKPENVLLDEEGEPHVADFGCARREDAGALLTVEGQVMGTPAYMSPEQAAGHAHLADGRSDVWSLGIMLEEMLTGQRPFRGTLTEILVSIRDQEPKPIRQHNSHLPKDLETIVQKCLAKRPEERFQTAGVLVEELQRWQRGEPIVSRRISVFARTWRWARRNPTVALLLTGIVGTALLAALLISLAERQREFDRAMQIMQTEPQNVQGLLEAISNTPYPRGVAANFRGTWNQYFAEQQHRIGSYSQIPARAGLGLLAVGRTDGLEGDLRETLMHQMLAAPVDDFLAIRDGIGDYMPQPELDQLKQPLWAAARGDSVDPTVRLRAYAALATFDPDEEDWNIIAEDAADRLLAEPPLLLPQWLDAFRPVRDHIRPWLLRRFEHGTETQQEVASAALAELYFDSDEQLAQLMETARPWQLRPLVTAYRDRDAHSAELLQRLLKPRDPTANVTDLAAAEHDTVAFANAALAEFIRGNPSILFVSLRDGNDPSLRTELLERLPKAGIDFDRFGQRIRELSATPDPSPDVCLELSGWILAIGGFGPNVAASDRLNIAPVLERLYRSHPDPGVHTAIDWAYRQWNESPPQTEQQAPPPHDAFAPTWRENSLGETMIALGPVTSVTVGSPGTEQERFYRITGIPEVDQGEQQRQLAIPYRFEIASREVTADEFLKFELARIELVQQAWKEASRDESQAEYAHDLLATMKLLEQRLEERQKVVSDPREPARDLRWSDAIAFCRWLSEREGVPAEELCYPSVLEIALAESRFESIEPLDNALQRSGYRLPTMVEWEYAARGLTNTPWHWGHHETHRDQYSWSKRNAAERPQPVGLLKPNRFGLFDSSGNVGEWCHDRHEIDQSGDLREIRGGSHDNEGPDLRPARRKGGRSGEVYGDVGFRVARTVP